MIALPPGFLQPHGGGGGGDPYFSNVVLLLHGSDFLDYSSHVFGPATVGAGVTIDSSVPNAAVGNDCFRVTGAGDTTFQFPACPQFKRVSTYTLEYWVYFDAVASNNLAMCSNFGTKFLQFLNASPNSNVGAQGWAPTAPNPVSVGAWHWVVLAYDAGVAELSQYIGGAQVHFQSGASLVTDSSDQDMDVISALSTGGQHRMMEIRYTQGICRYPTASGSSLTVQTAPWPNSA